MEEELLIDIIIDERGCLAFIVPGVVLAHLGSTLYIEILQN